MITVITRQEFAVCFGIRDRLNCAGTGCQDVLGKTMFRFHKKKELLVPCLQGADCNAFGRNE
jgi:hypothetical protein